MTVPSATNMKFKFPPFRNVDDGDIEFAIEEAVVACGNGAWIDDANLTLALMYYAAHLLQVAIMRGQAGGAGQVIQSERTPELSVTYAVPAQPSLDKPLDLTMTIYGVRFVQLARKNFPAVLVANSAVAM
jgi:hypothetical protein